VKVRDRKDDRGREDKRGRKRDNSQDAPEPEGEAGEASGTGDGHLNFLA
jgi:hypothetical protein